MYEVYTKRGIWGLRDARITIDCGQNSEGGDRSVLRTSYVETTTRHLFYLLVEGRLML